MTVILLIIFAILLAFFIVWSVWIKREEIKKMNLCRCCRKKITIGEMTIEMNEFTKVKQILEQTNIKQIEKDCNMQ